MQNVEHEIIWHPLKSFGVDNQFFALSGTTIISTWIALAIILALCLLARSILLRIHSENHEYQKLLLPPDFTFLTYGKYVATSVIRSFMSLVEQSTGAFVHRYFNFIAALFIFILICNWVALIPYVEEPTKNLNTTLALGTIALLYIQKEIIKVHGFGHYLKEYFLPVSTFFPLNLIIGLFFAPFKILGELATVISLSFRLFGNIFGGAIIMQIWHNGIAGSFIWQLISTIGVHLGLVAFFVIFEGGLQAFVFTILTLTNISMATAIEEGKH